MDLWGIIDRLTGGSDAAVTGPLDPRRVDTIVDAVASSLAEDRCVLVTGNEPRTLTDLRDMLPPELQQLCGAPTVGDDAGDPHRVAREIAGRRKQRSITSDRGGTLMERLREQRDRLRQARRDVDEYDPASRALADAVLTGRLEEQWDRSARLRDLVTTAYIADDFIGTSTVVDVPARGPAALEAYDALARALENGGVRRRGLGRLRRSDEQAAVEALGRIATVDGLEATTAVRARAVAEHLRALDALDTAELILRDLGMDVDTRGPRNRRIATLARAARARELVADLVARTRDVARLAAEPASERGWGVPNGEGGTVDEAVPVWIVPVRNVAAWVPSELVPFDIVIVDNAE